MLICEGLGMMDLCLNVFMGIWSGVGVVISLAQYVWEGGQYCHSGRDREGTLQMLKDGEAS